MHAYIALCLATGIRTEEARALRWEHVSFGNPDATPPIPASAAVWRCPSGLQAIPRPRNRAGPWPSPAWPSTPCRLHKQRQDQDRHTAGERWNDQDLVCTTRTGAALDAANVRREFRATCRTTGIGPGWTPRELRHSFVSLMSSTGVPVEEIARLAGHTSTRTTELVYRRELRPVLTTGAEAMDTIFKTSCAPVDGLGCS